ncbi:MULTISPECIES: MFS transporter [Methylococcus]|jgi:PPP family 3-phenylpropionic acid transporter|uniref:MFS transporter, PPP family, 3-phenylpropionic acid transporter n=1 Tax=Methylococcus capsulatus TaxID=414 RepID=A0AA35XZ62_METCP|nr:MFS transporter [Methylococcus capsulatus]QXP90144.1 MFS transporter [Methylococcus capsulatus]CAI8750776.1 MFS transporter, PPP family, 3-phenylpropionic acid transporter [Methylococcus capsulatus]
MPGTVPYWRLSGLYLWYFAALGTFLPYWPLYLQARGFGPQDIGVIMAVMAATRIVAPNGWGWLADHTGRDLFLIRLACLLTFLGFGLIFVLPGYWGLFVAVALSGFFWNAFLPTLESLNLALLRGDARGYSRIRLWGSVGFILGVLAVGAALEARLAIGCLPQVLAFLFALMGLSSLAIPGGARVIHVPAQDTLWRVVRRPEVIGLLLTCLLIQMAHGPYYSFYSVHLENHGFDRSRTGQFWALGVLSEIVLFLVLPAIQARISLRPILLASIALTVLRWLLIGRYADRPGILVFAQTLHAASFGAFHAVSIALVHRYFQGRNRNRGQALFTSLSYGAGGALGSFASGYAWADFGAETVYAGAAVVSFIALIIAWRLVDRRR